MTSHATLASMSRHDLVSIAHDLSVSEALAVVRVHRVHHLPVTQGDTLVGLVCSCDLHAAPLGQLVTAIMRKPVVALDHDADAMDAVSIMNAHHVGSVVLMDGARARAVLTRADVLVAHPELAPSFTLGRDCCGHARQRCTSADGHTSCTHCADLGADGRGPRLTANDARNLSV